MELTFNKVGKQYEAEFELSADANLHIEFKNAAPVKLYQRTAGSGWDLVNDVKNAVGKATDVDLVSLIYPKFVKVVCIQEPTYATVTTDGEITEIKSQSKEIEVTSNGTMDITPDAGFAYLNSVKVKTNVPTSGEGGGGVGYLYFENVPPMVEPLVYSSLINDGTRIIPSFLCGFNSQGKEENITVHKIAAMYGYTFGGMKITEDFLREVMSIGGIVEITEEEFYNLNA